MDHVTYALIIFSGSFILYLYVNLLMALWENSGNNSKSGTSLSLPSFFGRSGRVKNEDNGYVSMGSNAPRGNGHIRLDSDANAARTPTTATSETIFSIGSKDDDAQDVELSDAYWNDERPNNREP